MVNDDENEVLKKGINVNPVSNEETLASVAIKVPPFWLERPEIWFAQLEAQFQNARVMTDKQRFNTLAGHIDRKILAQVSDAVLTPPEADKYNHIKESIIECFADTEQRKIKKLLTEMSLGDKKPSQLLNEMRSLASTNMTEDFLKSLWLQRLPTQVQAILSASDIGLRELSLLADKIIEVVGVRQVSAIVAPQAVPEVSALTAQEELTKRFNNVNKIQYRSRSRSKSSSSSSNKTDTCWYHRKFKERAKKYLSPCSFNTPQKN